CGSSRAETLSRMPPSPCDKTVRSDSGQARCTAASISTRHSQSSSRRDVRWIFLSHDDRDHSGNLMQVLDRCPNATLVTTFVPVSRMTQYRLPFNPTRSLNHPDPRTV